MNLAVQFEIVKALRNKELQVIGKGISMRWLNAQHVGILRKIWGYWNFFTREETNCYMSLDSYKSIPLMSFNMKQRSQQYKEWGEKRKEQIMHMDFGLDLDFKEGTYMNAIEENQAIRDLFNKYQVKYSNWCSGSHGFHFIIPYEDMPEQVKNLNYDELITFYREFALLLQEKIAPHLDLSIYMPTRVLKCPYTISKNDNIIWPLCPRSWELLKKGELPLDDPLFFIKNFSIRNRGVYFGGSSEGIKKLFNEWNGEE
jgi:hypothetical protein